MKELVYLVIGALVLYGCTTTESLRKKEEAKPVEAPKTVQPAFSGEGAAFRAAGDEIPDFSLNIVTQEKPIYVPETSKPGNPGGGVLDGRIGTKTAVDGATINPYDWNGTVTIYDYNANFQYRIYTQPLRITVIDLEAEETVLGSVIVGDSSRWTIGASPSPRRDGKIGQSIYIRPFLGNQETSMVINTNKRRYMCVLYSTDNLYMAGVQWRYPMEFPVKYMAPRAEEDSALSGEPSDGDASVNDHYTIEYAIGGKPDWAPTKIFDNGKKTVIVFPKTMLNRSAPGLTLGDGGLVNYRQDGNLYIVDALGDEFRLFLGDKSLKIKRDKETP